MGSRLLLVPILSIAIRVMPRGVPSLARRADNQKCLPLHACPVLFPSHPSDAMLSPSFPSLSFPDLSLRPSIRPPFGSSTHLSSTSPAVTRSGFARTGGPSSTATSSVFFSFCCVLLALFHISYIQTFFMPLFLFFHFSTASHTSSCLSFSFLFPLFSTSQPPPHEFLRHSFCPLCSTSPSSPQVFL